MPQACTPAPGPLSAGMAQTQQLFCLHLGISPSDIPSTPAQLCRLETRASKEGSEGGRSVGLCLAMHWPFFPHHPQSTYSPSTSFVPKTCPDPSLLCTHFWAKVSLALFSVLDKDCLTPLQKALTFRQEMLSISQNMSGVHHEITIAHQTSCCWCRETSPYTYAGCQHWMEHSACSDFESFCPETNPVECRHPIMVTVHPCHTPAPLQPFPEMQDWANLPLLHLRKQFAGRTARWLPSILHCWRLLQQLPVSLCLITGQPAPHVSLQ